MKAKTIACRLRTLRKKSGLSLIEVAQILGYHTEIPVSRHERSTTVPNLLTAIGYEVIFHRPVSEFFPGIYLTVEAGIEERLAELEETLHQSTAKGRSADIIARKLVFLCGRKIEPSNETP